MLANECGLFTVAAIRPPAAPPLSHPWCRQIYHKLAHDGMRLLQQTRVAVSGIANAASPVCAAVRYPSTSAPLSHFRLAKS